jgi:hypothetical protein
VAYRHNKTTSIVTPEPERYKAVVDFYSERYSEAKIISDIGTHAKRRTYAHTHRRPDTSTHKYGHSHIQIHTHTHTHTQTHARIHTHTHTHIHTRTHTHTHAHTHSGVLKAVFAKWREGQKAEEKQEAAEEKVLAFTMLNMHARTHR